MLGNTDFVRSLCLPHAEGKTKKCKNYNPCQQGGVCLSGMKNRASKCKCAKGFVGCLCRKGQFCIDITRITISPYTCMVSLGACPTLNMDRHTESRTCRIARTRAHRAVISLLNRISIHRPHHTNTHRYTHIIKYEYTRT